jgi:hypothetical protein
VCGCASWALPRWIESNKTAEMDASAQAPNSRMRRPKCSQLRVSGRTRQPSRVDRSIDHTCIGIKKLYKSKVWRLPYPAHRGGPPVTPATPGSSEPRSPPATAGTRWVTPPSHDDGCDVESGPVRYRRLSGVLEDTEEDAIRERFKRSLVEHYLLSSEGAGQC